MLVHLTAEQAALPAVARQALFQTIVKVIYEHQRRYHRADAIASSFLARGGGGWLMETGKRNRRFEGKTP